MYAFVNDFFICKTIQLFGIDCHRSVNVIATGQHQFLILLKLPSDTNQIETESMKRFRYHQKYHLQQHTYLCSVLDLDDSEGPLLRQSHLAARLNGFLAGFGSLPQIEKEGPKLGLDEKTLDYVRRFFIEYQGQGLTCQLLQRESIYRYSTCVIE